MTATVSQPAFCAMCVVETTRLVQRPLGRGDALVWICGACDGEHPRAGRYAFESADRAPTTGRLALLRGDRRVQR